MAFRTDLAREQVDHLQQSGVRCAVRQQAHTQNGFSVHSTYIENEDAAQQLGKPCGCYHNIGLAPLFRREDDAFDRACTAICRLLNSLLPPIADDAPVLVAGLGNRSITPDAIGPRSADHVIATRHLIEQEPSLFASWRPVSVFSPGVLGQTGVETGEILQGLCTRIHPAAVIAVDALACGRLPRLMRSVQLTDTGITPGSGVGNARKALRRETLGVPVIAVGVPSVVDGATLAQEIRRDCPPGRDSKALDELSYPLLVTTRDIDREVTDVSRLIGYAINLTLFPHLKVRDVDLYLR